MFDLQTLGNLIIGAALGFAIANGWGSWKRSKPRPIEALRSEIQERRESLRKAAATEYGRRTDRR